MKNSDRIISLGLIIFSVCGYFVSLGFKGTAGLLPQLVFISLFICAVALLIQSGKNVPAPRSTEWKRWFLSVSLILVYVVSVIIVGFYVATFVFIASMMYLFGVKSLKVLLGVPLGFDLLVYIIFAQFLGIIVSPPFFLL